MGIEKHMAVPSINNAIDNNAIDGGSALEV